MTGSRSAIARRMAGIGALAVLVALVTAVAATGCGDAPVAASPERLAGVTRTGEISGENARRALERMHGKDVVPESSRITRYAGPRGEIVLYVSDYGGTRSARRAEREMLDAMGEGRSPFAAPLCGTDPGGRAVAYSTGMGQDHLILRAGRSVVWLAADPPLFAAAARELIDSLPE